MGFIRHVQFSRDYYCTRCHVPISANSEVTRSFDFVILQGWCNCCRDLVSVTSCKVPYWTVGATAVLSLFTMVK